MRTTLMISKHNRCICILEMIERCERIIKECKRNSDIEAINKYYRGQLQKYSRIRSRLVRSYADNFQKMVEPVMDKVELTQSL